MKQEVERAIAEIGDGLPGHPLRVKGDENGGAYVIVDGFELGSSFSPNVTWVGFHITWSYPDADVYPHFVDSALRYIGSGPTPNRHPEGDLPVSMTRGHTMPGFDLPAIHVSRQSRRRNAATDTALQKLIRVVESVRSR